MPAPDARGVRGAQRDASRFAPDAQMADPRIERARTFSEVEQAVMQVRCAKAAPRYGYPE